MSGRHTRPTAMYCTCARIASPFRSKIRADSVRIRHGIVQKSVTHPALSLDFPYPYFPREWLIVKTCARKCHCNPWSIFRPVSVLFPSCFRPPYMAIKTNMHACMHVHACACLFFVKSEGSKFRGVSVPNPCTVPFRIRNVFGWYRQIFRTYSTINP